MKFIVISKNECGVEVKFLINIDKIVSIVERRKGGIGLFMADEDCSYELDISFAEMVQLIKEAK
jgi:hypothetical protein